MLGGSVDEVAILWPDSCHRGTSLRAEVEGAEDGFGGWGEGVFGEVFMAGAAAQVLHPQVDPAQLAISPQTARVRSNRSNRGAEFGLFAAYAGAIRV